MIEKLKIIGMIAPFLLLAFIGFLITFRFGYDIGNRDGLKKAYRIDLIKKYPFLESDLMEYNGEYIENRWHQDFRR